jgi:thiol-disulfide isomerase/thioredoxin
MSLIRISLILVLLFSSFCQKSQPELELPKYPIEDWNGQMINLIREKDQPFYLFDVWASWCEPCKESAPLVDSLYHEFQSSKFVFYGINTEEGLSKEEIRKSGKEFGMSYPSLLDPNQKLADLWKLEGQPAILIFNPQGKRIYIQYGFIQEDKEQLANRLKIWLSN